MLWVKFSREIRLNQIIIINFASTILIIHLIMLYRVIIGNYRSFGEEQEFNMFPNMRRDNFTHHIYNVESLPVLKESAIYGANGAGKSNFVKALAFIEQFTTEVPSQDKLWLKNWYLENRFRLPVLEGERPIGILVEFGLDRAVFIYNLEIGKDGVNTENLYLSGKGKGDNTSIFSRSGNNVTFEAANVGEDIRKIFIRQISDNPSASILALNGTLHLTDDENMANAYRWFKKNLSVISVERQIPWLIEQLKDQKDVLEFVNHIFSEVGLGISHMDINASQFDDWINKTNNRERNIINALLNNGTDPNHTVSKMGSEVPMYSISVENGERMVREFIFNQIGRNGYTGTMNASAQSAGTLRLLSLVPALYYAMKTESTVVIDEIDNGIHPILIKHLIKFFGKSDTKGQLIFTTHETPLLNQKELLRADEVWFTEKKFGETQMYSLNDFKYHKSLSVENGYLDGRFGAIPFLGSLE